MLWRPRRSPLFPYTTLFRSNGKFTPIPGTDFTMDVDLVLLAMGFTGPVKNGLLDSLGRSGEHTSELQSPYDLVCRLLLEKKKSNLNLGDYDEGELRFARSHI